MSETLYAIADRYREILSLDATNDDERAALVAALDEAQGDFADKAENIAKFIRNLESEADAIRAEEVRLANKRQSLTKKADNLTAYIEAMLVMTGQRNLKAGIFDIKFQRNPPSITILDESKLPSKYFTVPAPVVSKQAIKDDIKAGIEIPGIEIVQNERLVIK